MKSMKIRTAIATDASRVGKTLHKKFLLINWVLLGSLPRGSAKEFSSLHWSNACEYQVLNSVGLLLRHARL
jgi:hypothetical protein